MKKSVAFIITLLLVNQVASRIVFDVTTQAYNTKQNKLTPQQKIFRRSHKEQQQGLIGNPVGQSIQGVAAGAPQTYSEEQLTTTVTFSTSANNKEQDQEKNLVIDISSEKTWLYSSYYQSASYANDFWTNTIKANSATNSDQGFQCAAPCVKPANPPYTTKSFFTNNQAVVVNGLDVSGPVSYSGVKIPSFSYDITQQYCLNSLGGAACSYLASPDANSKVINTDSSNPSLKTIDGGLGLAFGKANKAEDQRTLTSNFFEQFTENTNQISKKEFSFYLSESLNQFILGERNEYYASEKFTTFTNPGELSDTGLGQWKNNWKLAIDQVYYGSTSNIIQDNTAAGAQTSYAFFSTTQRYFSLSSTQQTSLKTALGCSNAGTWGLECPCTTYKPIVFKFKGSNKEFSIPPEQYLIKGQNDKCIAVFRQYQTYNNWVLGTNFLRQYYTVFDQENNQIHLAKAFPVSIEQPKIGESTRISTIVIGTLLLLGSLGALLAILQQLNIIPSTTETVTQQVQQKEQQQDVAVNQNQVQEQPQQVTKSPSKVIYANQPQIISYVPQQLIGSQAFGNQIIPQQYYQPQFVQSQQFRQPSFQPFNVSTK